jgi:hypothetical protein
MLSATVIALRRFFVVGTWTGKKISWKKKPNGHTDGLTEL